MSTWAAILLALASFWQALRDGFVIFAAKSWQSMRDSLANSRTMVDQLNEIIEAEHENDARPVAGAADRLQHSGFTRDDPTPPAK